MAPDLWYNKTQAYPHVYLESHVEGGIAMKMKDIPNHDRPYERCLRDGPGGLTDEELLSVIIRTGSRRSNSKELASQILALNYPKEGILGLLHLSLQDLMQLHGIGEVKGIQLLCIGELSKRIWRRKATQRLERFTDPAAIAEFYREEMRHLEQEEIHLMLFNNKQTLVRELLLSRGTVNASVASPREIFIEALRYQAVSLALVHNHPSGDPEPSQEDILMTYRVSEAGKIVGVLLLDHVVIGDGTYVSLKERGYI